MDNKKFLILFPLKLMVNGRPTVNSIPIKRIITPVEENIST